MNFLRHPFMTSHPHRLYPNPWDIIALFIIVGIVILLAWNAMQMAVPYHTGESLPISLDPAHLPSYALRTVVRMLIALFFSLLCTFIFGTWAAKSPRAERFIIPAIDILQSIPILGFLSITIAGFIALFPGRLLGAECAAIFAIFTSQAWNMIFGFYQSLRTVPTDMYEAARMFHLSPWQRFWRIDVPFAMPSLLWNMMMSISAGWFFVVASEAISVSNQTILLPGMGSYIAMAIERMDLMAIVYAILTMLIVIILYDQLAFRPLVAWAEKFKMEQVSDDQEITSWLILLFQRTRLFRRAGQQLADLFDKFVNISFLRERKKNEILSQKNKKTEFILNSIGYFFIFLFLMIATGILGQFIFNNVPLHEGSYVFYLGLATALRVLVLLIFCTVVWVPVGVWIGMNPKATRIAQPLVQFLAAFPANLLFPVVVLLIVTYHLSVNIWVTPLIILGTQWYILFNVIAGASALPKDLQQANDSLGVRGWLRWRRFILPGIFPYYITGAITAAGGAWNASIVAEMVNWGDTRLTATGLGAYIKQSTLTGDFPRIALGITMMCLFVLLLNRLVWRPLYVIAETRYQLE